jgi:hypothetical protein
LSARSPLTMIIKQAQKRVLSMGTRVPSQCPSWRQIFKPHALGLIGLAIAVVLWGGGYKLSLYHRHAAPSSRIPVAKLWIESRNASVTAASRLKTKSHLIPASQVFPAPIQRFPRPGRAVASILPVCRCGVAYFDFLIPFRSPPPHHFCLA